VTVAAERACDFVRTIHGRGAVDPFTDSSTLAHLAVLITATLNILCWCETVGALGGSGAPISASGATLTISGAQSHTSGRR